VGRETNKQRRERQAASAREKAAVARAQEKRGEQRRRAITVLGTVVAFAVVGVIIAMIALHSGGGNDASGNRVAADPTVVADVTSVSPATFSAVGAGDAQLALTKLTNQPPLVDRGKPELLFIGGEFCPICAAERWSMTAALARFGTFSDLSQMRSAKTDGNLATLSFYKSSYRSKYLTFTPVENVDRDSKELEKLTSDQITTYLAATGTKQMSYPFLDYGGLLLQRTEGYDGVKVLGSMNQKEIASQLDDPSSNVAKAVVGEANNVTAAICMMTHNQPTSVCVSPTITAITSQINSA
jgi:hypothetical protein